MPTIYISKGVLNRLMTTKEIYCKEKNIGEHVKNSITPDAIISELLENIGQ